MHGPEKVVLHYTTYGKLPARPAEPIPVWVNVIGVNLSPGLACFDPSFLSHCVAKGFTTFSSLNCDINSPYPYKYPSPSRCCAGTSPNLL